jgi:multiple sugar transport system substrate-binding protein/raffinose/stachyose/melibiose transport system substrate-binding protein
MSKKTGRFTALAAALAIGASAVVPGASLGAEGDEPVTLQFWHRWTGAPAELITELIADFEAANPDVRVEQNALGDEEYKNTIRTVMASGSAPDVFFSYGGTWLSFFVDAGLVAPLDEYYAEYGWDDRFVQAGLDGATYADTAYSVPFEMGTTHFLYNKGVFEDQGLTISKEPTWEEFLDVAESLKEAGLIPIAFGNKFRWPSQWYFDYPINRMYGRDVYIDLIEGRIPYDDPRIVAAMDLIKTDLAENGYFNEDLNALDWFEADALFAQDRAGMYLNLAGGIPYMYEKVPEGDTLEVGWFVFPTIDPDVPTYIDSYVESYLAVSSNSEHPDAAARFLDFLTSSENATRWNQVAMTAVEGANEGLSPLLQELQAAMGEYPGYTHYDIVAHPEIASRLLTGFQEVLAGTKEVEDALAEVEATAATVDVRGTHPNVSD